MPELAARYGIRRSDGQWYIGTVDRKPVFSIGPHVASFGSEEDAAVRMEGLAKGERHGRAFGVLPIDQVAPGDLKRLADEEQARDAEGGIDG